MICPSLFKQNERMLKRPSALRTTTPFLKAWVPSPASAGSFFSDEFNPNSVSKKPPSARTARALEPSKTAARQAQTLQRIANRTATEQRRGRDFIPRSPGTEMAFGAAAADLALQPASRSDRGAAKLG